jgi:hypothetical protein
MVVGFPLVAFPDSLADATAWTTSAITRFRATRALA